MAAEERRVDAEKRMRESIKATAEREKEIAKQRVRDETARQERVQRDRETQTARLLIMKHRETCFEWHVWKTADLEKAIRLSDTLWANEQFDDAISLARIALFIVLKTGGVVYPRLHIRNAFGLTAENRWREAESEYQKAKHGAGHQEDVQGFDDFREYLRQPKIPLKVPRRYRVKPGMTPNYGEVPDWAFEYVDDPNITKKFAHVLKYQNIDASTCYPAISQSALAPYRGHRTSMPQAISRGDFVDPFSDDPIGDD